MESVLKTYSGILQQKRDAKSKTLDNLAKKQGNYPVRSSTFPVIIRGDDTHRQAKAKDRTGR